MESHRSVSQGGRRNNSERGRREGRGIENEVALRVYNVKDQLCDIDGQ
jgi:hypothetical protein